MIETWKPVPIYNHKNSSGIWKYEVSNLGNIRIPEYTDKKNRVHKEKILKHQRNQEGYHTVCLSDGQGKQKRLLVSRLVAMSFVENPNNEEYVNHIDENKDNNSADNLEWCSRHYNLCYGTRIQRVAKLKSKPIRQYSISKELIAEYPSIREAERQTGFANANIHACCRRKLHCNTRYGYIWRFKEDDEYENKN